MREYRSLPGMKAILSERRREYNARPEVKARKAELSREYRSTLEYKERRSEYRREYNARPEVKARLVKLRVRPEVKAWQAEYMREYRSTPEHKEQRARYRREHSPSPAQKLASRLRSRFRHALKNKSKRGSAIALLGCTIDELIARFDGLFTDGMTWENQGEWHIDHIKPLSKFDLENPQELAVACHYTNLQPLWAFDNISKSNKTMQGA